VPEAAQQATVTDEPQASVEERRPEPFATTGAVAPEVACVEEEAPVGEFRKTCHPRNVEVYEIREMSFQEHQTCEDLES
jgi:hypothetical protein